MLGGAGCHLAAPFIWQVGGCFVVILDLTSAVRRRQVDAVGPDLGFSVLAVCVLRFLSKPCLSCYILMFLLLCSVAESISF